MKLILKNEVDMKYIYLLCVGLLFVACGKDPARQQYVDISASRDQIECGDTGRRYFSNGRDAYCQHPASDAPNEFAASCPFFTGVPSKRFDNWCGIGCKANMTLDECREVLGLD